jgi:hypothetical protein
MAVESALGVLFPKDYISLLTVSNGFLPRSGKAADYAICLYAVESLIEMAAVQEMKKYLPGHIHMGSDGGGRGLFLKSGREPSPVYLCGQRAAISAKELTQIADSLEFWLEAECDLGDQDPSPSPARIDVVVARPPRQGIGSLRRACLDLGLQIPVARLASLLREVPFVLCEGVPFLPAARLVARLNRDDPYLQSYDHRDKQHTRVLPPYP